MGVFLYCGEHDCRETPISRTALRQIGVVLKDWRVGGNYSGKNCTQYHRISNINLILNINIMVNIINIIVSINGAATEAPDDQFLTLLTLYS